MGLRLLRRSPAPAGRHARAVPGPLVPGAAAALVASADPWVEPVPAAYNADADAGADRTAPITPVLPVAPVLLELHQASPAAAAAPAELPLPAAAGSAPLASYGPVSLGFADGAQVDLPADDPRVRTFRAAAAALLESPRP